MGDIFSKYYIKKYLLTNVRINVIVYIVLGGLFMTFYDKDGKPYNFNISKDDYFDRGTQAKIYKISDTECLKVMNRDPDNYFKEDLFNEIKSLSLKGLVKLGMPFYVDGKIKQYIMEYLVKNKKSILDMPTEYTTYIFNSLYKDILVLTKNLILAKDLYYRNLILGESKATIIDFDGYKKLTFDDDLLCQNTFYLLYAFKGHYKEAFIRKGIDIYTKKISNVIIEDYLSYLFDYTAYDVDPPLLLEKKLKGVRTPMELFNIK